jgi:hypothetical protein
MTPTETATEESNHERPGTGGQQNHTAGRHTDTTPQLPDLDPGITLLDVESGADSAIHALTVDHILRSGGEACWVDPGTHARTGPLVEVAPSARVLDRIHVARGFTPFQHLALLDSLPDILTDRTELVVVPAVDRYYRDDDLLADEGQEMLLAGVAALASVGREHDVPVLLTRTAADRFSEPVATAATETLACESTPFGPRFHAGDEETLVYPVGGGRWVQTTLSFWAEIIEARRSLYDAGADDPAGAAPPQSNSQPSPEVTRGTN